MHFTREPIIETIITPKEGSKLLIRNSKGESSEEFLVEAIEVVSFGHSFFFRSQERPKSFLVPVSDYEVIEVKETRLALKTAGFEKIKIGGGKPPSKPKESEEQPPQSEDKTDRKRNRRNRRRRGQNRGDEAGDEQAEPSSERSVSETSDAPKAPLISRLIPPPPTLISQSIGRYKEMMEERAPSEAESPAEAEGKAVQATDGTNKEAPSEAKTSTSESTTFLP